MSRLLQRANAATAAKAPLVPILEDCYRLALPGRSQFTGSSPGDDRSADYYDDTAVVGLAEFASRFQAGMTPNYSEFSVLKAGADVADKDKEAVNKDLEDIQKYVFEQVWASNFSAESFEAFLDMGISTGMMLVEDGGSDGSLTHNAIPLTQLEIEAGPDDGIGGMFRTRTIRAEFLPILYPDANFSDALERKITGEQDSLIEIKDCLWRDFTNREVEVNMRGVIAGGEEIMAAHEIGRGPGSSPFYPLRMGKAAGEVWGRGPMMNVLAGVKTLNFAKELMLQSAAMSLIGMYQTDDDQQFNAETISFAPGAVLPKRAGSEGLKRIDAGGREFRLSEFLTDSEKTSIKRGLYNDMLSDPNRTPATAFEVSERNADLGNRLGAAQGRVNHEFVSRYMMRALYVLERRQEIELPVMNKKAIVPVAQSPLASAQGARGVQNLMQYHQVSAAIFGPQMAAAQYDLKELSTWLRAQMSTPASVFQPIEDAVEAAAQMMQQMGVGGAPAQ